MSTDTFSPGGRLGRVTVSVATESDRDAWDAFVIERSSANRERQASSLGSVSGYHSWAWRQVFEQTLGHECVYLVARLHDRGRVYGILPLVFMKSWIFGRTMTSLPFVNYGGVVADSSPVARALL